jgi:hypothetical protein
MVSPQGSLFLIVKGTENCSELLNHTLFVTGHLDTGHLDKETAGRLGIGPEVRQETRFVTTQDKPPAGTKWAKGSGRARKTPQTPVKK